MQRDKVTNYETPYLGLSALSIEKFDLLILDLSLPEMDGLEVCRLIRQKSDIKKQNLYHLKR